MTQTKTARLSLFNLYLVSFMGSFGYFLLIPILLQLVKHSHTLSHHFGAWLYAVTLGLMPLVSVLTAPSIGKLSDRLGRKWLIVAGCSLNLISFIFPIIAITTQQVVWLIIGSVLNGFAANAQPLSQAAIADMSQGKDKARRFGLDAFSMALATIVGPLCGFYLSDHKLVSWFNLTTPFYLAILLALLTILLTLWTCPRQQSMRAHTVQNWHILWRAIADIIRLHPQIKRLLIAYFLMQVGWAVFYQDIGWFFHAMQHGSTVADFLSLMGICALVSLVLIYPLLLLRFSYRQMLLLALGVSAVGVLVMTIPLLAIQWIVIIPVAIAFRFYYPSLLAMISDTISATDQGWLISVVNALLGLAWFLSGFIAVGLQHVSMYAAHIIVVLLLLVAFVLHCLKVKPEARNQ